MDLFGTGIKYNMARFRQDGPSITDVNHNYNSYMFPDRTESD